LTLPRGGGIISDKDKGKRIKGREDTSEVAVAIAGDSSGVAELVK